MTSDLINGCIPPVGNSPYMKLPEHVDGFVDVQTLVDIHKYLIESENSDDIALAAWIKKHYLQEPLIEEGRQIRDTEGFVKLDAAYRRTRQLTGKAQDKWPFFDRSWKKMSSTVVKNLVLGDAAIGTDCRVTNNEIRALPMSNGFDGQRDSTLQTPRFQTPASTKSFNQQQAQLPQPIGPSSASQPRPEQKAPRQAPEPLSVSRTVSVPRAAVRDDNAGYSAPNGTPNGTMSPADLQGASKAHGSQGRYVNRSKSPGATKKGPNIKYVKKSRSKSALGTESEDETEETDYLDSEVWSKNTVEVPEKAQKLQDPLNVPRSEDGLVDGGNNNATTENPAEEAQSSNTAVNDSPTSSVLAVEADAVPSNLDRLPPGLTVKKRKNESAVQRGGMKRARGSRGGLLGRPRKSETVAPDSQQDANKDTDMRLEPSDTESAKMTTRQSVRKSVTSASHPPESTESAVRNGSLGAQYWRSIDDDTNITPNNFDEYVHGSERDTNVSFTKQVAASESQMPKMIKTPISSKRKKRVSFSPEARPGNVEFFARISTDTGTQDIRLSEEDLTSELKLIKRYSAWLNSGETDITFETFKKVIKFAK